jgi:hypothetical protein
VVSDIYQHLNYINIVSAYISYTNKNVKMTTEETYDVQFSGTDKYRNYLSFFIACLLVVSHKASSLYTNTATIYYSDTQRVTGVLNFAHRPVF